MEPLPKVEDLTPKLRSHGIELPVGVTRVGAFGDSAALSEELLSLIRSGRKCAGASLLWAHEADADPVPSIGEIEIVVDHRNAPRHDGPGAVHARHDLHVDGAVLQRGAAAGGVADGVALGMLNPEILRRAHQAFGDVVANAARE